jgi:molecular chaperone GrpE
MTENIHAPQEEAVELEARVAELDGRWRTALAEADNLRKRGVREAERVRRTERAHVAAEWLPVLDNLDAALEHAHADSSDGRAPLRSVSDDALVEGVRAVRDQAVDVLARLGFPRRDDEPGTAFDPTRHEAVGAVPTAEVPAGTVAAVVRSGYGDGETQLRPPRVVVAQEVN